MMTRGGGYSRPEANSRNTNEEVRGRRIDNRTQQYGGDRNRLTHNFEEVASVGRGSRPTTNRLREQPEATQRPQTQRGPAARKEERSRDKTLRQPPRKQAARKSGDDKENKPLPETQRAPRGRSQEATHRRPSREKSEFYKNNPNFIRVGQKKMNLYIFLMKRVFVETPHQVVELSGIGDKAIMTVLKIVETVTRVGYVTLTSIKTVSIKGRDEGQLVGKLRVLLKKTSDFDRLNAEFVAQISANPRPIKKEASEPEEIKAPVQRP